MKKKSAIAALTILSLPLCTWASCKLGGFNAYYKIYRNGSVVGSNQRTLDLKQGRQFTFSNHMSFKILWIKDSINSSTQGSYSSAGFIPKSMYVFDARKNTKQNFAYKNQQNNTSYILQLQRDLLLAHTQHKNTTKFAYYTNILGKNITLNINCQAQGVVVKGMGNTTYCVTQAINKMQTGLWYANDHNMLLVKTAQIKDGDIGISSVLSSYNPSNSIYCALPVK